MTCKQNEHLWNLNHVVHTVTNQDAWRSSNHNSCCNTATDMSWQYPATSFVKQRSYFSPLPDRFRLTSTTLHLITRFSKQTAACRNAVEQRPLFVFVSHNPPYYVENWHRFSLHCKCINQGAETDSTEFLSSTYGSQAQEVQLTKQKRRRWRDSNLKFIKR